MPKPASSTQSIIDIDYVKNDTVVLKNGGLRKILLVSGINFDLKSEEEKGLLVFGYQEFLNSLNFSIQEIIHSRKLNNSIISVSVKGTALMRILFKPATT